MNTDCDGLTATEIVERISLLVNELKSRASTMDALQALIRANSGLSDIKPAAVSQSATPVLKAKLKRKRILHPDIVLSVLEGSGRSLTLGEIHKKIGKGTKSATASHLRRLAAIKQVERIGASKPFAWQLTREAK
jgi:hypothetical protein